MTFAVIITVKQNGQDDLIGRENEVILIDLGVSRVPSLVFVKKDKLSSQRCLKPHSTRRYRVITMLSGNASLVPRLNGVKERRRW